MICQCGCGQPIVEKPFRACKYYKPQRFIIGHNLRLDGCHVLTDEHKRKIGLAHKGRIGPMLGRHHSSETKEKIRQSNLNQKRSSESRHKMRLAHLGIPHSSKGKPRPNWRGANSSMWKDGASPERNKFRGSFEYIQWSRSILEKSHFRCVRCGEYSNGVHHLRNYADYPELRLDPENGASICKECHEIFHWTFGKKLNNEKQFARFLIC